MNFTADMAAAGLAAGGAEDKKTRKRSLAKISTTADLPPLASAPTEVAPAIDGAKANGKGKMRATATPAAGSNAGPAGARKLAIKPTPKGAASSAVGGSQKLKPLLANGM
jgi:molybdopterin biosynthesis enzyme